MGMLGDNGHPAVQEQLKRAAQMCKAAGKPSGIVGGSPEMVGKFIDYGYTWIAIGSDMSLMVGRAQEWLGKARGQAAAPKADGGY
jgi:2-keto-3-deoxy-L-rhamnonate aldolase RhmA